MDQTVMLQDEGVGLDLAASATLRRNLSAASLIEQAIRGGEGTLVADGAFATTTGPHTGRSPKDRFIVDRPAVRDAIDWGEVNRAIDPARADRLWAKARAHAAGRDLYVQELFAAADPAYRLRVRVITETAWHSLFARNMFRVPEPAELRGFEPDFTVVQLPSCRPSRRCTAPARAPRSCSTSSAAPC